MKVGGLASWTLYFYSSERFNRTNIYGMVCIPFVHYCVSILICEVWSIILGKELKLIYLVLLQYSIFLHFVCVYIISFLYERRYLIQTTRRDSEIIFIRYTHNLKIGRPNNFSGVRVALSLVFCVVFCRSFFKCFFYFFFAIALSVLLRFTDCDYPFGICKLFLKVFGSK